MILLYIAILILWAYLCIFFFLRFFKKTDNNHDDKIRLKAMVLLENNPRIAAIVKNMLTCELDQSLEKNRVNLILLKNALKIHVRCPMPREYIVNMIKNQHKK